MDAVLIAIEQSQLAILLRTSRWGYAALSALHITGIALLVGSIVPLDLRLLGFWPAVARSDLARVLGPTAATGLLLALSTGLVLFSVRATEYAALSLFWGKLALVAVGGTSAVFAHIRHGFWLNAKGSANLPGVAFVSIGCWLTALAAGRSIAFAQ